MGRIQKVTDQLPRISAVACCKEPKSADCTQVYSTFVSLSGSPVVGDVFMHASSAGVRVVLTSRRSRSSSQAS